MSHAAHRAPIVAPASTGGVGMGGPIARVLTSGCGWLQVASVVFASLLLLLVLMIVLVYGRWWCCGIGLVSEEEERMGGGIVLWESDSRLCVQGCVRNVTHMSFFRNNGSVVMTHRTSTLPPVVL